MGMCWCGDSYDAIAAAKQGHKGYCSHDCRTERENAQSMQIQQPLDPVRQNKSKYVLKKRDGTYSHIGFIRENKEEKERLRRERKKKSDEERWRRKKIKQERRKKRKEYRIKSNLFLESKEWQELRLKALAKYGRSCMACGRRPPEVILHVDHIRPRYHYPELALDMNNLQVLCSEHNQAKGAKYEFDFRPGKEDELMAQYRKMFKE